MLLDKIDEVQRISASQSLGFKDLVLESSEWLSAATLVSYCPSRSSEIVETATTKHSDQLAEIRCTQPSSRVTFISMNADDTT